jgi:hypothetical protein
MIPFELQAQVIALRGRVARGNVDDGEATKHLRILMATSRPLQFLSKGQQRLGNIKQKNWVRGVKTDLCVPKTLSAD